MKNTKHKWNGKSIILKTSNHGGLVVACVKCGCVKEFVKGVPTYFINDTVYDRKAPKCDERLL